MLNVPSHSQRHLSFTSQFCHAGRQTYPLLPQTQIHLSSSLTQEGREATLKVMQAGRQGSLVGTNPDSFQYITCLFSVIFYIF
jgi:hypothetical protein